MKKFTDIYIGLEKEVIEEENKPTNPKLWSRAKALARSKFDVYPSAYANMAASKYCKDPNYAKGAKRKKKK